MLSSSLLLSNAMGFWVWFYTSEFLFAGQMVSGCGESVAGALQGAGSRHERRILNIKNEKQ